MRRHVLRTGTVRGPSDLRIDLAKISSHAFSKIIKKGLIYLFSICLTMALLFCLLTTGGFRDFANWESKPFLLSAWGMLAFGICLTPLLLTSRVAATLQSRTLLQICGSGGFCGLMVLVVWSSAYFAEMLLREAQLGSKLTPVIITVLGLVISLGLAVIGILNDGFLTENIRAVGWLLFFAGTLTAFRKDQLVPSILTAAAGLSVVVTIMLVTGHANFYGRRPSRITREDNRLLFWSGVLAMSFMIIVFIFSAVRLSLSGK
jgi:hypothetical protein